MLKPQFILPLSDELVVDLFAGGGGASTGIEQAIGRHVDIAVTRRARVWTITDRRPFDTSVSLTLRCGSRTVQVSLPVCIYGPCWADVGLRPVHAEPRQAGLFRDLETA